MTRARQNAQHCENAVIQAGYCRIVFCLSLAILLCRPADSWAWGSEGHRIIALVADRLLRAQDPSVQKKIAEILATDKSNDWTKTDIASEATWADALREKSPEGRAASSKWHYVKLDPGDPDLNKACFGRPALSALRPASHGPSDNCVIEKIGQFAKELRDPATSPSERLMALQFLLNLVGDVHDPLYAIEHHDQSGRCAAVLPPGGKAPVRLSVYWEDTLVAEAEGRDPVKAAAQIVADTTPAKVREWSGGTPEDWARQSYELAKAVVYDFPRDTGSEYAFPPPKAEQDACGPVTVHRLDTGYRDRALAAVKEQLAKAGARLAFVLRENLK
ncbi:MAG: S1/P1 nuclease [Stellaceae bacterium]